MSAEISRRRKAATGLLRGLAAVLVFVSAVRAQIAEIPYLTGRVTDNAEILTPTSRERITQMIRTHEAATGNQIAVLTMPSLDGSNTEEFASQVFRAFKLGEKGKENGVLLLLSPGDRRMRIEVGSGLKGNLTEATADRIVRDLIAPRCNEGDYGQGLEEGIRAIVDQLAAGEPSQAASTMEGEGEESAFFEGPDLTISERILIGSFIFGIIGLFTIIGVLTPGVGWFLYLFLIPFWAMFPIVVVGTRGTLIILISYLVGFPLAKLFLTRSRWYAKAKATLQGKNAAEIGGFTVRSGIGSRTSWSSD